MEGTRTAHPMAALATLWRLALLGLVFVLGVWANASGTLSAMMLYREDISFLTLQHLELVAISGAIAIVTGIPIGILLARRSLGLFGPLLAQIINLGTTIPTLAILALAMTVLGLGAPPAIFGLAVLTLLPIVLNTVAGLRAVPPALVEAARGMGMTNRQILFQVELPNALFVIAAGIRTALAINVGTVPLAFLIGGGGLGELIFTGIDLMDTGLLLAGAIPTALLAVGVDLVVGQLQFWLVPRGVNPLR
ncbi:ABC transporter permease [Ancylobacter dichloromethanicus]|uniref:ABC transporter permease n=1 Tax=Ancylobacter dichloromethanicus TaxID=518825 RepID=A0A9W6N190_9HYPH|nr:ABC transporter permease [Ancylobacter dichloromethanicus]MBS7553117.1 ABC transporter permease [Ancylobacter dichloromethanicus]GLK74634.1 ABC transporter permease [Ancylobacter dichloromethanicus]